MDLFVAVGVLFAIGYAAGFGVRTVSAHMREQRALPAHVVLARL